jgi:hypothetical protein
MSKRKKKREDVNHKDGRKEEKKKTQKNKNLFTNNMTNHNDKYIRTLQTTM